MPAPSLLVDLRPDSERSALVGLSTSEAHRAAGGLVIPTPLARWSDANEATGALHVAMGRAYVHAMSYGEPSPATVAELRGLAERVLGLLP